MSSVHPQAKTDDDLLLEEFKARLQSSHQNDPSTRLDDWCRHRYDVIWDEAKTGTDQNLPQSHARSSALKILPPIDDKGARATTWTWKNPPKLDEVRQALERSDPIWIEGWHCEEAIDLTGITVRSPIVLLHCKFDKPILADAVTWLSVVQVWQCQFLGNLSLAGSHFNRGVHFHDCFFGYSGEQDLSVAPSTAGHPRLSEAPARSRTAWWPGLRVKGILRVDRCTFAGSLNLAESEIRGPLLLRGIFIGSKRRTPDHLTRHNIAGGRLYLRQVKVNGDVDLQPHLIDRQLSTIRTSIVLGSIVLAAAEISGRVDTRGAFVLDRLHLPMIHIKSRLVAGAWVHPHDEHCNGVKLSYYGGTNNVAVRLADATIDHGVWMDGAQMFGQLHAKNARIGGDFYVRRARGEDGEIATTSHENLQSDNKYRPHISMSTDSDKDAVRLIGATIFGSLEFDECLLNGPLNLNNIEVGGDVILRNIVLGNRDQFAVPVPLAEAIQPLENTDVLKEAPVESHHILLLIRNSQVARTVDLRGAWIACAIDAHGLEAKGDVLFGSWQAGHAHDGRDSTIAQTTQDTFQHNLWQVGLYRDRVTLAGLRVAGDLSFRGGIYFGSVLAEGTRIGHRLDLTGAVFYGTVDFDDSDIGGDVRAGCVPDASEIEEGHKAPVQYWTNLGTYFIREFTLRRSELHGDFHCEYLFLGCAPDPQQLIPSSPDVSSPDDSIRKTAPIALEPKPFEPRWDRIHLFKLKQEADRTVLNLRLATIEGAFTVGRQEHSECHPPDKVKWIDTARGICCPRPAAAITCPHFKDELTPHLRPYLYVLGSIRISHAQIKGQVGVRWAAVSHNVHLEYSEIGGNLDLYLSEIANDFNFAETTVKGSVFSPPRIKHETSPPAPSGNNCSHLDAIADYRVLGDLNCNGAVLGDIRLFLVPHEPSDSAIPHGPRNISLEHARVSQLTLYIRTALDEKPFLQMKGLHFDELELHESYSHVTKPQRTSAIRLHQLRRFIYSAPQHPRRHAFFLRKMLDMDSGLYARVESWLRRRNEFDAADEVFLERRLQEVQRGPFGTLGGILLGIACTAIRYAIHSLLFLEHRIMVQSRAIRRRSNRFTSPSRPDSAVHAELDGFNDCAAGKTTSQNTDAILHRLYNMLLQTLYHPFAMLASAFSESRNALRARADRYIEWWKDAADEWFCKADASRRCAFLHPAKNAQERANWQKQWEKTPFKQRCQRLGREFWFRLRHFRIFARLRLILVGDGIRTGRLVGISIVLYLTSALVVFSNPESVEHPPTFIVPREDANSIERRFASSVSRNESADSLLKADEAPTPVWRSDPIGTPDKGKWSKHDAFWVALNVHIPLAQFAARDEWVPASEECHRLGIQYDTYATIMQIWGWIAIPLIITSITSNMKRRSNPE